MPNFLMNIIFPIKCLKCGRFIDEKAENYLCDMCFKLISIKKSFQCVGCKRNIALGQTCLLCRKDNPLDQLLIASDYTNPLLAKLIKIMKYNFVYSAGNQIFLIVEQYLNWIKRKYDPFLEKPLLIPVPLHKKKLNFRGFNQAEIISSLIADSHDHKIDSNILIKTQKTKSQVEIKDRKERLGNIKGVFEIKETNRIRGRNILLIDDICTTGATLNECARVLKQNGATKVTGLVVARG
jgi:competence protein ComFC